MSADEPTPDPKKRAPDAEESARDPDGPSPDEGHPSGASDPVEGDVLEDEPAAGEDDRPSADQGSEPADAQHGSSPGSAWRSVALVAGILALVIFAYFLPRLLSGRAPAGKEKDPKEVVQAVVKSIRSSVDETAAYEPLFVDKAVAGAIAQNVRAKTFPKGLDIKTMTAEVGEHEATVTVEWTVKRPDIKENGTAFSLRFLDGSWKIADAASRQVP